MQTTPAQLNNLVASLKKKHQKVGLILGCFDLLHPGHLYFLKQARALVDVLIVGLESDAYVKRTKGPNRPINPILSRIEIMDAIRYVDFTFKIPENPDFRPEMVVYAYKQLLLTIAPTHFFTVSERDRNSAIKQKVMAEIGINFVGLQAGKGTWNSTTELISRLRQLPVV